MQEMRTSFSFSVVMNEMNMFYLQHSRRRVDSIVRDWSEMIMDGFSSPLTGDLILATRLQYRTYREASEAIALHLGNMQ